MITASASAGSSQTQAVVAAGVRDLHLDDFVVEQHEQHILGFAYRADAGLGERASDA